MKTEAVVHDDDCAAALQKMAGIEAWGDDRKAKQRQVLCWYGRNSMSVYKSAEENLAVFQRHVERSRILDRT